MEQMTLPMLTVYEAPRLVDLELIDACQTYRDAVRACWELRTRPSLTMKQLALDAELYRPHVSEYVSAKPGKRDLPAAKINGFEISCGNRFITQWTTRQAQLTHLELVVQQQAQRRAAA